jgi:hypothetical protein
MRLLSVILLTCIVWLSAFGGSLKPAQTKKDDCCSKMAKTHPQKSAEKKHSKDDCEQQNCPLMFSCSICGFFTKEPIAIQKPWVKTITKPVAHYITGSLADYHADNWKPPKAC